MRFRRSTQKGLSCLPQAFSPNTGNIRLKDLRHFIPVSKSHLWAKVKKGTFLQPVKLDQKITAWRAEDIQQWDRQPNQLRMYPAKACHRGKPFLS